MRIGLDLRALTGDELLDQARQADELGVWAVLVNSPLAAAELATTTNHVHLALFVDTGIEHPLTIAEEIAVLDHLSARRMLAVVHPAIEPGVDRVEHLRRLLAGHIVDGVALAPPPAQTAVPVWERDTVPIVALTGDLDADRLTVDTLRDEGRTHVFVQWPAPMKPFARHLLSRALTPDFPQIVADHADVIAPIDYRASSPRAGREWQDQ